VSPAPASRSSARHSPAPSTSTSSRETRSTAPRTSRAWRPASRSPTNSAPDWLQLLADRLAAANRDGTGIVITCSALKRAYRDLLRAGAPDVRFVFLTGGRDLLAQRLAARRGHFMPPSLLDSQLATLEEPAPDEAPLTFDIAESPRDIVAALLARLREDR
jgi:carbohydrate kinase (thermoresistant glucokinase family)